jgi:hypothetical protein
MCVAGMDASATSVRLLVKILTGLEHVRTTQVTHSKLLNMLLRHGTKALETCDLPDGIILPVNTPEEVETIEVQLQDNCVLNRVVS